MARLGRFMVGPFTSWIYRDRYVDFIVHNKKIREKLASHGIQPALGLPLPELERVYIDREGSLWLLINSREYDLVKHFRGKPSIFRRLPCLWAMKCRECGAVLETSLQKDYSCLGCGETGRPVVFWRDPYSHESLVGPCSVAGKKLECGGRTYYVGEVVSLSRDMLGNLYAKVLSFLPGESVDARMVEVMELPELGWSRPEVVAE
ncbi:MAG: hypothetical protein QW318_03235 [Candidatus Caldarchaeum sp.]|jgi:hypothetical protein|uniref:Uncharacterized protein n=1 Tax=Caldiarchaeum subterraneum TaxID=311458 RepID=A0A7J3G7L8_CALS0